MICSQCKRDLPVDNFPFNKKKYLKEQKTYERHGHCKGCAYSRDKDNRIAYQRENAWRYKDDLKVRVKSIPTQRDYPSDEREVVGLNGLDEIFC